MVIRAFWQRAVLMLVMVLISFAPAHAVKPFEINNETDRIDIAPLGEAYEGRGDTLQIETATAADGTAGRISVRASTQSTNPNWFAFAMRNPTDKPIERWIVAERYQHARSGVIWPNLDARRIENITPSLGLVPERLPFDGADVFRLTVEPGQTVTFVAELSGDRMPRLQLWRGLEYEKHTRNRHLFHGILLGITGLLALFLTAVFAANHKAIFPAAALFTWVVLAYLCVDFGFWNKLFNVRPEENAQYRAATEAAMSASLLIFTHTFLRIGRWHGFIRMLVGLLMLSQLSLVGLAFLDPKLAATFARLSFVGVLVLSAVVTLYLVLRRQDRALAIVPAWILFGVWVFGTGLVLTGRLQSDVVVNGLIASLVLLVVLIGFTVTQFAFRSLDPMTAGSPDDQQLRALAVDGTGSAVFDWHAQRDEVRIGALVNAALGLEATERREPFARFAELMHPADRERLAQALGGINDRGSGNLRLEFRVRHVDNSYRWFELDAAAVPTRDRRPVRCVGLVRETTDARRAQERLLADAVNDSLTGLPNRGLFLDRLAVALTRAQAEALIQPTVFYIDLDRFKTVNSAFGPVVGDSLLITVARRLGRLLGPSDTLARVSGDQFAMIFPQVRDDREQRMRGEDIRAALKGPISIAGQDIVLTGSIGFAEFDTQRGGSTDRRPQDLLGDAEVAMYRARRSGPDRIERFERPMSADKDARAGIENELRLAIDKKQIKLLYQPIVSLRTNDLVGFEAQASWEHPRLGVVDPSEFVPLTEESDLFVRLGSYVLTTAVAEAQRWQKEYPRPGAPIFLSINVSSRQLFRPDLVTEVQHIMGRGALPRGALRLEVSEALVMENPEQASHVLDSLVAAGARLSLDEFGAGYSSVCYLSAFPFDTIKIDQALVHASAGSASGTAILRSIVALAHELGKIVIAEGIETDEDASLLRSVGCEQAQGTPYGDRAGPRETMHIVKTARRNEKRMKRNGLFRLKTRRIDDDGVPSVATAAAVAPTNAVAANVEPNAAASPAPGRRAPLNTTTRPRTDAGPETAPIQTPRPVAPAAVTWNQNRPVQPAMPVASAGSAAANWAVAADQAARTVASVTPREPSALAPVPQRGAMPPPIPQPMSVLAANASAADRSLHRLQAEIARSAAPIMSSASVSPPPAQASAQVAGQAEPQMTGQGGPQRIAQPGLQTGPTSAFAALTSAQPPPVPGHSTPPMSAPRAAIEAVPVLAPKPPVVAAKPPNLTSLPPAIAASLARLAGAQAQAKKVDPARDDSAPAKAVVGS
jgi:diguanylate cyclase (GGDEF)-like protein